MWHSIFAGWAILILGFLAFMIGSARVVLLALFALVMLLIVGCSVQPYVHVSAEYPLNNGVVRYVEGERIESPLLGVVELGALFNLTESIAADCAIGHRSILSTMRDRGEEFAKCGAVYFFGQ